MRRTAIAVAVTAAAIDQAVSLAVRSPPNRVVCRLAWTPVRQAQGVGFRSPVFPPPTCARCALRQLADLAARTARTPAAVGTRAP